MSNHVYILLSLTFLTSAEMHSGFYSVTCETRNEMLHLITSIRQQAKQKIYKHTCSTAHCDWAGEIWEREPCFTHNTKPYTHAQNRERHQTTKVVSIQASFYSFGLVSFVLKKIKLNGIKIQLHRKRIKNMKAHFLMVGLLQILWK